MREPYPDRFECFLTDGNRMLLNIKRSPEAVLLQLTGAGERRFRVLRRQRRSVRDRGCGPALTSGPPTRNRAASLQ